LSATAVIQAAPNDIAMMHSATEATTQDARLSIEEEGDCNIKWEPVALPFTGRAGFDYPR
jgi:hypothetical protein